MATLTTPGGLPYPDGTEPAAEGDNAIGALALAVDTLHSVRRQRTTGGSIPNGAWTPISVGTTDWSVGDIRGDTASIIVDSPGLYLVECYLQYNESNATGRRMIGIGVDTTSQPGDVNFASMAAHAGVLTQIATFPMRIAAANTRIYLWGFQDSGGTRTLTQRMVTVSRMARF